MKLISLNCHGLPFTGREKRFPRIAEVISRLDADVVFLQEVIFAKDIKHFENLGYKLFFQRGWVWIKGGLIVMTKDKSVGGKFLRFKKQGKFLSKQMADRLLGKGMWAVELDKLGITVVNAHLVRAYRDKKKLDSHQIRQIDDLIGLIREKERVIVAGDLNVKEGSVLYEKLTKKITDLTKGMGASFLKKGEKLDYVMTTHDEVEIKVRCFVDELLDEEWDLSDHRGIYVELVEAKE